MATRARVGYIDPSTNKVTSIYCHNDGYLEGLGENLQKHFNTLSKVKELMRMGGASTIKTSIEDSIFYTRDMLEPAYKNAADMDIDTENFIDRAYNDGCDWAYLFQDDVWTATNLQTDEKTELK